MALKHFLKENRNARKLFGKKEIGIIIKQIEGVMLTQSERNRLSRDIKPKFTCIKELGGFADEFPLKKNQENRKIIERAVETLLNDTASRDIEAILLFGSFADHSFTHRSDIDIGVVFKTDISLAQATKFRMRAAGELPDKVDIHVFNVLPQNIKRGIARNHKVLYANQGYDNLGFTLRYLKDEDYTVRMREIFGAEA